MIRVFLNIGDNYSIKHELDTFTQSMQLIDVQKVILPRGLRFVDRTSMASSVETRVPLLDHGIAEFSLSVPTNLKINENETRYFMKSFFKNKKDIDFKNKILKQKKTIVDPQKNWLRFDRKSLIKDLINSCEIYKILKYLIKKNYSMNIQILEKIKMQKLVFIFFNI